MPNFYLRVTEMLHHQKAYELKFLKHSLLLKNMQLMQNRAVWFTKKLTLHMGQLTKLYKISEH